MHTDQGGRAAGYSKRNKRTLAILSAASMAGLAVTRAHAQVYLNGTLLGQTWSVSSVQSGNFTILGDASTFTPSGGPALPDGTLIIDDSATAGGSSANYFPSNTITMSGGSIDYIGNASSATATTISSLSVLTNATIASTPQGNLTINNLLTNGISTITFRSVSGTLGGGASAANIFITQLNGNSSWTTTNGIIGGWATTASGTGATNFATYGANGVTAVTISGTLSTGNATSNVSDSNDTVTGGLNPTVNSLTFNGSGDVNLNGNTVTLNSGGLIIGGPNHWLKNGSITAGAASNYTIFATVNDGGSTSDYQLNGTQLIDNGGNSVSLVKAGIGQLKLVTQSSFSGNVTVNGGILMVTGGGNNVGNTDLGSQANPGRTITVNNGATLAFTTNNVLGSGQSNVANIPSITVAGGKLSTTRYDVLGNLTLSGGTLAATNTQDSGNYQDFQFLGTVTVNGNAPSTIANGGTIDATHNGDHLGSNTVFSVSATGGSGADLTISAPLRNQSGDFGNGAGGLTLTGNGVMALTGNNTYTGVTTLNSGILNTGTLANSGTASAIGNATASAGELVFGGGTLQYTAAAVASTNRLFTIGDAAGNTATIDSSAASSANTVSFTSTGGIAFANAAPNTLTLTGSNTGANTFAPVISDQSGGNPTSLIKAGNGTWALTSSNSFTGATTVAGGTLIVDGSGSNLGALGNTNVGVAGGATLKVKGNTSIGGNISLAGGTTGSQGNLSLVDGAINTLSLAGNLNVGAGPNGSLINLDLGSANGSSDLIAVGGSVSEAGVTSINLNVLSTLASGNTTYTLVTAAGGGINAADFAIGSKPAGFNNFSLNTSTANALILTLQANATPTTAYWTGLASSSGSPADPNNNWGYGSSLATAKSNWSTTADGLNDPLQVPGSITDVFFTAANASSNFGVLNTQLDSSYSINSITFDTSAASSPISSVGINTNGNTLALQSGNLSLTIAASDTSNTTISGNATGGVLIGASQNWANNSNTKSLTVSTAINGTATGGSTQTLSFIGTGAGGIVLSGAIGDGATGHLALVFNQAGVTQLNNANTFTGGTTISSGTIQLGNPTALGAPSNSSLLFGAGSTGVLALNGNSVTVSDLNTNATAGTPIIQSGSGTAGTDTLTVSTANSDTYAGILQDGGTRKLALAIGGGGSLTLSGSNSFSGGTTINAGTVILGSATALGAASSDALTFGAGSTGLLDLNGNSITLTDLNTNATAGSPVIQSGPSTTGTDTLNLNTANTDTYAGVLRDGGGASVLALTKSGSGSLTLSARNSYSGGTTVNGGNLTLTVGGGSGSIGGNLTINAGATVNLAAQDALGYTSGSQVANVFINGGTLDNTSGASNGYITNFTLAGGTLASGNSTAGYYRFNTGGYGITSLGSNTTSLISAPLRLSFQTNFPINVASGNTTSGIDLSITGSITEDFGSSAVTKGGSGTLLLTASNGYSGGTTIAGGTLEAIGHAVGTGPVTVAGGIIAVNDGTTPTAQTLTTADQTWKANSGYTARIFNDGTSDQLQLTGGTSSLTIDPSVGSSGSFTVTAAAAAGSLDPSISQDWVIAADITSLNGVTAPTSGNPTVLATAGAGPSSSGFILNVPTSLFSGIETSAPLLELEAAGSGGFSLDVVYSAAPEPGTTLLVLAGAMPALAARRRRREKV